MTLLLGARLPERVPLVFAGATKIAYDLLLWREFRRGKPPEELEAAD